MLLLQAALPNICHILTPNRGRWRHKRSHNKKKSDEICLFWHKRCQIDAREGSQPNFGSDILHRLVAKVHQGACDAPPPPANGGLISSIHESHPSLSSLVNWFDSASFWNGFDSTRDSIRFLKNEPIHLLIQAVMKIVIDYMIQARNHLILIQFTNQIRIVCKSAAA